MRNLGVSQTGQDAYADATGVNGASGYGRAVQNFHTGPGYQFLLDQGTQAALRGASGAGTLASGGTLLDLQTMGQGLANQQWQNYVSQLQPFLASSTANAQGAGNINTTAGTTAANLGAQRAGTAADIGKAEGATTAQLGGQGAGITATLGGQGAGITSDLGKAAGSTDTSLAQSTAATEATKAATDADFAKKLADMHYQSAVGIGNANANKDLAKTNANANIINALTGIAPGVGQAAGQFGSSLASGLSSLLAA